MRLAGLSLVSGLCLLTASVATADELRLTDSQMDQVVAGSTLLGQPFEILNSSLVGLAAFELRRGLITQYETKYGELPASPDPTLTFILDGLQDIAADRGFPPPP